MPKYAEWIEYERGKNGRILKRAYKQSRQIYDENETCYLIHDRMDLFGYLRIV